MAKVKIQSFLILEQTLTKRLVATWRKSSSKLFARIQKAIQREDWTRVEILIDEINFSKVLSSNKRFMSFVGRGAFLFGVARHDELKESKFVKDKEPIPLLTEASENLQKIIAQQGDVFVKNNIRRAVATIKERIEAEKITKGEPDLYNITTDAILILKERVRKAAKVRTNAQLLKNAIDGRTDQYLENVSSLHNSRLAGWGYVQEAEALGITTYRVSEQIESDTICPICISMHGKEFQVQEARQKLNQNLTIDNLNDLKHVAPFPNQSKAGVQSFRNLSNTELVSNGWHVPPYHPRCRGLLVRSTDKTNLGPLPKKAKRRIPPPARLPVQEVKVRNISGLDKIDSDEVRRLFPSLINDPAKARKALVVQRTTDQMLDALKTRDAEVLFSKIRGRSPAIVSTQTAKFKPTVTDPRVVKMITELAEQFGDSGMNPAILRNRPIARLHVGGISRPRGVGRNLGTYWGGAPDADKLIYVSRRDNLKTLRHEFAHHFDFAYTRLTPMNKFIPERNLGPFFAPEAPKGLGDAVEAMQIEFRKMRTEVKGILGRDFQVNNFNHWETLNSVDIETSRRVSAYSTFNDREWMAEWGALYYQSPKARKIFKKAQPATFKLIDDINKGKYLHPADIKVLPAELRNREFGGFR